MSKLEAMAEELGEVDATEPTKPEDTGAKSAGKSGGSTDTGDGASSTGDTGEPSGEQPAPGGADEAGEGSDGDGKGTAEAEVGEDSGYVVDEVEEETVETPETKETVNEPSNLTPELQYIVDRLPVLSVRGKDGKTYQVKAAGQLPDDFDFASKREEMVFAQSIAAQELAAQRLKGEYDNQVAQDTYKKYSDQENTDIRSDMGDLQREGLLPRFQYAPNSPKFESDPAVKTAQDVMDYMNERNQKYAQDKKPYRITFRDAFEQLQAKGEIKTESKEQTKEDTDRKQVTRQTAGVRTTSGTSPNTARISPSLSDLVERIEYMDL